MSESSDYTPSSYAQQTTFQDSRRSYAKHAEKRMEEAKAKKLDFRALIPDSIKSEAASQLIVVVDVTGSMDEWPATIFSKLPYLAHEVGWYLGKDTEICWAATGDANSNEPDEYAVQVRPFAATDEELAKLLKELVNEHGGGGQAMETYELLAYYMLTKTSMPNAIRKPIIIFIGDEAPYDRITKDKIRKFFKTEPEAELNTIDLFAQLCEKFAVYHIHKPYQSSHQDVSIRNKWIELLGEDHVANLPNPDRVVDVMFGILGKEANMVDEFRGEIEGRQTKSQVQETYRALVNILPPKIEEQSDDDSVVVNPGKHRRANKLG